MELFGPLLEIWILLFNPTSGHTGHLIFAENNQGPILYNFFKWTKSGLFLFIFVLSQCKDKYRTNLTISDKSVDGVLHSDQEKYHKQILE